LKEPLTVKVSIIPPTPTIQSLLKLAVADASVIVLLLVLPMLVCASIGEIGFSPL